MQSETAQPDGGFAPDVAVEEQLDELERRAAANLRQDRRERMRFVVLRSIALLSAGAAALWAGLGTSDYATALGVVAALAIAIDSAWPIALRSPAMRAAQYLRELESTLRLRWAKVRLTHPERAAPQRVAHALAILDEIAAKRDEITRYLN